MASPSRVVLMLCVALLLPLSAEAQGLKFFKNYFTTGGHFAAGVALKGTGQNGIATGQITIPADVTGANGIPYVDINGDGNFDELIDDAADILVALLYWETVTTSSGNGRTGATFRGTPVGPFAKFLNPSGTPPCWSNGGATGGGSAAHQMKAYRADVAPLLPPTGLKGKRNAIGTHTITMPDSGTGNAVPSTAGVTLLLVYSVPGKPLTATVIYDGGYTINQGTQSLTLPMLGWFEAATAPGKSWLTQIVANGQSNFGEALSVKNEGGGVVLNESNPFVGGWDTFRRNFTLPAGEKSATVAIERGTGSGSFDCLSWGAMVLSTPVQDADKDGIVDRLESEGTPLTDPTTGEPLPNLFAMGARPYTKDIFIEFGFMRSTDGYSTNGVGQTIPAGHSHLPDRAALDMVAKAFRDFTVDPLARINVHFDLGNPAALPIDYRYNWSKKAWDDCFDQQAPKWTPDCAIIPATLPGSNPAIVLADGGEFIEETPCALTSTRTSCEFQFYPPPATCAATGPALNYACRFQNVPGTVLWKSGFRYYRDEPLSHRKTVTKAAGTFDAGPDDTACAVAETDTSTSTVCTRRFARSRHDLFHYVLWAHALGIPRDPPNQAQPRNVSGIADYLGSDLMVTLGLWDHARGTTFMQASTFMHELGHNLGRRHGGDPNEPNCKPNYQSVMNYLFQVRGLINDLGVAEIGFSNQVLKSLNEQSLVESAGLITASGSQPMQWRTRWYTRWNDSFIDSSALNITPVAKRCNGAPHANELMARVDGATRIGPIDWDANGGIAGAGITLDLDLNFSGLPTGTLNAGANDWLAVNLQAVGGRRNVGGWSAESGYWDTGYWDTGSDIGYWDTGYWDTGSDVGYWDTGYWDTGYWDTGYWDSGYWDTGVENDLSTPLGELDLETAAAIGNSPNAVTVAIPARERDPVVSWLPPHVGTDKIDFYEVWRVEGTAITPLNFPNRVQIGGPVYDPTTSRVDTTTKNNTTYLYFVLAQFDNGQRSGIAVSQPYTR
jgi:hypothetical protein